VIAAATEAPRGAHHVRPERRHGRIIGAVVHVGVFGGFSIASTWPQAGHWYVINSGIAPTVVVDSLKVLDPKRPIREADIGKVTALHLP
jgi:hypothetical protein